MANGKIRFGHCADLIQSGKWWQTLAITGNIEQELTRADDTAPAMLTVFSQLLIEAIRASVAASHKSAHWLRPIRGASAVWRYQSTNHMTVLMRAMLVRWFLWPSKIGCSALQLYHGIILSNYFPILTFSNSNIANCFQMPVIKAWKRSPWTRINGFINLHFNPLFV